ncbi:Krueppel homolog 2 [Schistocerca piceifrons]|uniref:Krueppel homolog 2 n=1 Tax=Schistocerca piceifrons TaxID=274613 RepID=UPI001F5EB7E1|nr:Krueppel homolog 2 [Schistocerca piceifrons]XP_047120947.1 Krueppel homolog 2 [Schistocerca piceifrons]
MADTTSTSTSTQPQVKGWATLKKRLIEEKVEVALWATRIFTIFFTFGYFVPIFGNAYNAYYKALMSNAATSALRLHQRIPRVSFSKEFLQQLLSEDSCHYLLYSLIFLYVAPVGLVLLPVFLFAVLQFSRYSLILLDDLGQNSWWAARLLISLVEFQTYNILRLVAFVEIVLMPIAVLLILVGKAGLITPFVYYHFLQLRYTSRRNRYTRTMFYELRVLLEHTANKPSVPGFVRSALRTIVAFTLRLAPQLPPGQQ